MNAQNEFISFKILLKQVYSAHTTKVKELENEVKSLKEQLIEKERTSNSTAADCKRCIELEEAFKSCKKALHEQSKMFENFGQKFSIFNTSELGSQDLKNSGISNSVPEAVKTSNLKNYEIQCNKNESSLLSPGDTITESKVNGVEKLSLISNNQNLLKNVMCLNDNLESFDVLTVTFPENINHNAKSDSLILAPDSLDVNLDTLKEKTSVISKHKKIAIGSGNEILKDFQKSLDSKISGKRSSTDSLNEDRIKRYNTGNQIESCAKPNSIKDAKNVVESFFNASNSKDSKNQTESCSKFSRLNDANNKLENFSQVTKTKSTKVPDVVPEILVTNEATIVKNVTTKSKMSLKELNKQNSQVLKKKQISTEASEDSKIETPKNSTNSHLVNDLKKKTTPCEISPSLLPKTGQLTTLPKVIDVESMSNDNDDFQENTSNSKFASMEDSWDICDKKKSIRKNKSVKSFKATSKYKMTLDAPPANYKKPNYKQTKLSKSLFKVKEINLDKNSSARSVSNHDDDIIMSEDDDDSPTDQPQLFHTSTQCPNKLVDVDATFIPEHFRLESPDFVTSNVKKNAVEKSNFKNGSLFSNISFSEELKSATNGDIGNEYEHDHSSSKDAELKENMNSFDRIPMPEEPKYKYKNEVVRKKAERMQLNAFDCNECEKYYSELGLSDKEKKERMKKCSRHRAKFTPPSTPDHFWELDFPDTQECKARGYMNTTQKVKLNNICNL